MQYLQQLLLTVLSAIISITDGCGRVPATPPPTDPPQTTTPGEITNKKTCTLNETRERGCLNGGECFALEIDNGRSLHCLCKEGYIGETCFYIDPRLIFQHERDNQVKAASIAASIVAVVLFVTVILCILIFHRRYKRRKAEEEKQKQQQNHENGNTTSLLEDQLVTLKKAFASLNQTQILIPNGRNGEVDRDSIDKNDQTYLMNHGNHSGSHRESPV